MNSDVVGIIDDCASMRKTHYNKFHSSFHSDVLPPFNTRYRCFYCYNYDGTNSKVFGLGIKADSDVLNARCILSYIGNIERMINVLSFPVSRVVYKLCFTIKACAQSQDVDLRVLI